MTTVNLFIKIFGKYFYNFSIIVIKINFFNIKFTTIKHKKFDLNQDNLNSKSKDIILVVLPIDCLWILVIRMIDQFASLNHASKNHKENPTQTWKLGLFKWLFQEGEEKQKKEDCSNDIRSLLQK